MRWQEPPPHCWIEVVELAINVSAVTAFFLWEVPAEVGGMGVYSSLPELALQPFFSKIVLPSGGCCLDAEAKFPIFLAFQISLFSLSPSPSSLFSMIVCLHYESLSPTLSLPVNSGKTQSDILEWNLQCLARYLYWSNVDKWTCWERRTIQWEQKWVNVIPSFPFFPLFPFLPFLHLSLSPSIHPSLPFFFLFNQQFWAPPVGYSQPP